MKNETSTELDTKVDDRADDSLVVAVETIPAARDRGAERGGFLDM